ncbi:MAG: RIP metalloprotease RseP [Synechococcaceae cyanobacterium SM2_3_2]|nr:RIP metalloprotease RseP [Synechococcaceae cyanobacterium SM2_3_2]
MFVLISIGILALLILVHEAGHFTAAKLQGIHVNRFSLGFGPVLARYQGSETEYALRLLPLGGFVGFPDEDEDSPYADDDPDLLKNRPVPDRLVVMVAGVLANLIFAYIALVTMFGTVGIPTVGAYLPGVLIPQVSASGPAQEAGLQAGDIVLRLGQYDFSQISTEGESASAIQDFQTAISTNPGEVLPLTVEREGSPLELLVTPRGEAGAAIIGVNLVPHQTPTFRRPSGLGEILTEAASSYQRMVVLNIQGFGRLISNFGDTAQQLSGPVGIVKIGADLAETDGNSLFNFMALISINLAILNLLPLPALDGGHIAFLLLEAIRGKKLPQRIENTVMQTGLVLLLGLGVVLIFKDTLALFVGVG